MPFYLVTHTSLHEASDEVAAAEQAISKLSGSGPVTFSVKYDDQTTSRVVIDRPLQIRLIPLQEDIVAATTSDPTAGAVSQEQGDGRPEEGRFPTGDAWRGLALSGAVGFVAGALCLALLQI